MSHPLLLLLEALTRAYTAPAATPTPRQAAGGNGSSSTAITAFDQGRVLMQLFDEGQRINRALFRLLVQPQLDAQMPLLRQVAGSLSPNGESRGDKRPEDDLLDTLSRAQSWILQNPLAAQAIFSALVAEGRHFASTDAGAKWARAFAESDLVRKGRLVWEATTLNLLEERAESALPTTYLEVLRRAVGAKDFEELLSRLRQGAREREK